MKYKTEKRIIGGRGEVFKVGDEVGVVYNKESGFEGGGFGCATITKVTDTGFQYEQRPGRTKSVQYKNIKEIWRRQQDG